LKPIWLEAFILWPKVFRRAWPWLIFTSVVAIGFDSVTELLRNLDDKTAVIIGLCSFIFTLFLEAFSTIIISQIVLDSFEKTHRSLNLAVKNNLKPVFIETTRTILPITFRFLLLIIPGLVEIIRLFFVAYIVQFDPAYKEGKVDALERSRAMVRGRFWSVSFWIILTTLLALAPSFLRKNFSLIHSPGFYFLFILVGMAVEGYVDTLIYLLYVQLSNQPNTAP
jgi:hypothetical protein